MLEGKDLERLIGYALLADNAFRKWLLTDPQAAAASIEITISDQEAAYIRDTVTLRRLNAMAKSVRNWMPPRSVGNWQATPLLPGR
ncbi:MAG TPA: hypothetical protein PKM78_03790 [Anaerolineae bacterium]|nr:hypothetical protein [Anaerolineae bacterium]HNU03047.1 hypothetical protein [Anaerolineae bacterium]